MRPCGGCRGPTIHEFCNACATALIASVRADNAHLRAEVDRLVAVTRQAVDSEREACAAIAHRVAIVVPADAHPAGTAQQIEAEIRARGGDGSW